MLRRAANNAYSWWWASHVRTKQSKWLDENLQDIEEKVQYALKLLEDEGDSFAKRAEMYYKRRPELISFVEESFKAYRALAERYDHISKELQNANTTIASVFPDQVPEFGINEDDDTPHFRRKPRTDSSSNQNIPQNTPTLPTKMLRSRKGSKEHYSSFVINKSGLSKTEAVEEIDKLQKEILGLQTEKEFVKSSYENGLAKYWEIENSIMEKQERVCNLQDEFDESVVIEDGEAQILMSNTALKSCQEKLKELSDKQEKNIKETEIAREEFGNLSDTFLGDEEMKQEKYNKKENLNSLEEEFESKDDSSLTITDIADKIDELVNDVMNLESLFSSQAGLIHRLREEIDDLKAQIRSLKKEDNSSQADENTIMRNKLNGVKSIDQSVQEQSENIEKHLTRAHRKLSYLSKKLKGLKQEVEEESEFDDSVVSEDVLASEVVITEKDEVKEEEKIETSLEKHILSPKSDIESEDQEEFLQKLFANGTEGREKLLLSEYTKVLRNYKEVKKLLQETETKLKNQNTIKANDQKQKDQLYMLMYREDNATNSRTGQEQILSLAERQFQARVDALLSENLNLLVRFSNSFGQIQQFDDGIKDLHVEILKIMNQEEARNTLKSNVRPIYKHLTEIQTEMSVWLEKSLVLKEEINFRGLTLSDIQNELTKALKKDSVDSETRFTIYQGAKFEGEVSNMEKENKRILKEMQKGLDLVTKLQKEVDKTLEKLSEEFSLSEFKNSFNAQSFESSKVRIPLRSFIFDKRPKKQRLSIFSCIQPSMYKKMKPTGS